MENKRPESKSDLQCHVTVHRRDGKMLQSTRNIISTTGPLPSGKFNPVKSSNSDALICRKKG
jgi:hypothetical protein